MQLKRSLKQAYIIKFKSLIIPALTCYCCFSSLLYRSQLRMHDVEDVDPTGQ